MEIATSTKMYLVVLLTAMRSWEQGICQQQSQDSVVWNCNRISCNHHNGNDEDCTAVREKADVKQQVQPCKNHWRKNNNINNL